MQAVQATKVAYVSNKQKPYSLLQPEFTERILVEWDHNSVYSQWQVSAAGNCIAVTLIEALMLTHRCLKTWWSLAVPSVEM